MNNPPAKPFSELSDDEFYEHLRSRNPDNPWTLRELVEVERRGEGFLDRNLNLKKEYESTKETFLESMRGAVKPLTDNIRQIGKTLAEDSTLKSFELVTEKWKRDYSGLFKIDSPFLGSLAERRMEAPWFVEDKQNKEIIHEFGEQLARAAEAAYKFDLSRLTEPLTPSQLDSPATDPKTIEVVKEPLLKRIREGTEEELLGSLRKITENTKKISERVRFGWQQWIILIASVVAAFASVIGLFWHK